MLSIRNLLTRRLFSRSVQKCVDVASSSSVFKSEEGTNEALLEEKVDQKQELQKLQEKIKQMDEFSERLMKELPKMPDDHEFRHVFGSTLIRDPSRKLSIDQMESEADRLCREPNKFRNIIYDEGELDNSDLSLPPSKNNPHPFDPSTLPPSHARSIIAYVNHFPVLQRLVDIGLDLYEVDLQPKLAQKFLRLSMSGDVKPKLWFLLTQIGVDAEDVGSYLTRNPHFLLQKTSDLWERVNYLKGKKFNSEQIKKIAIGYRYFLNTDVKIIDYRLGWLQKQFHLTGKEVRTLLTKEPRILAFGTGPIQRLLLAFNNDFEFEAAEIKKMMIQDPRLFMSNLDVIRLAYNYLHTVMEIDNEVLVDYPLSLRCPVSGIRKRHEFLKRIGLNQYNPELPNYISLRKLLHPDDKYFAEKICCKFVEDYDKFMKTL